MFYDNEDRYDGFWSQNKPCGEGRMIYKNGDVYVGSWDLGKRSGYGVLTKYALLNQGVTETTSKATGSTTKEKAKVVTSTPRRTNCSLESTSKICQRLESIQKSRNLMQPTNQERI